MKQPARTVIVGTGIAGLRVAKELRTLGATGEIVMIGDDDEMPYDRPPLSKSILRGEQADSFLTNAEELAGLDIKIELGTYAKRCGDGVLETDGELHKYDALVIATGSKPRRLRGLTGAHYLRTRSDAHAIRDSMRRTKNAVVIGGGFIGCEVAATARTMGIEATIVEAAPFPLSSILGTAVAAEVANLHRQAGVRLCNGVRIARQTTDDALVLTDGSVLHNGTGGGQTLIAGVGVTPNSDLANLSNLATVTGGYIKATHKGRTSLDRAWALGDVAAWHNPFTGTFRGGSHWTRATTQATVVARDILGLPVENDPAAHLEYFWSDQYGLKLQMFGSTEDTDQVSIVPSQTDNRIVAVYGKEGRAAAIFGIGRQRVVMGARGHLAAGATYDEIVKYALQEMP